MPINLEKSVGSQESAQSIDVQDVQMQRLQEQGSVDAPGEIEKSLIMLLCSCTRKISASLHKTSKVTGNSSCIPCIHAIHGVNYEFFYSTMHANALHVFPAPN